MYVPVGYVDQAQLERDVAQAANGLAAREVSNVRFTIGANANGEPSIFFAVLLTPYGAHASRLADVTARATTWLFEHLQPYNRWGLLPYFNFTSNQAHFRDPGWM